MPRSRSVPTAKRRGARADLNGTRRRASRGTLPDATAPDSIQPLGVRRRRAPKRLLRLDPGGTVDSIMLPIRRVEAEAADDHRADEAEHVHRYPGTLY